MQDIVVGMKIEWKLSKFSVKNGNKIRIWKRKYNYAKLKWKQNFFGGSGNGNGTTFSDGTDVEMEFPFSTDVEFLFYCGFAWSI
jgi:hypothetical protein